MGPPLEKSVLQGYNACLLAYGQSGTGKTHTMLGSKDEPGIIPRLCHNIWEKLKTAEEGVEGEAGNLPGDKSPAFRMEVSFMEIYREKVRDLLNPQSQLKLREHPQYGPHVQNLSRIGVSGENGLLDLLWEGECRRAIGTTGSNRRSSRSHAIWTIYLTRPKANTFITNQVHLVDLAGSEKAGFATTKNLLAEGADINRSLVALGNVISSLAEKAQYIPYRDSALTWLLKDSLGGNATTAIIITSSPASSCHAQTLNSFRFAQRARLVENSPRINLSTSTTGASGSNSQALYSIMSAFEIKKDISRLSKVIQTAQNNGGLLRGLAPKANWTRLITALEGWNQIEAEQIKLQRAASEDAASLLTTSTKSDAMNQADLATSEEPSSSSANSSKFSSPSRIMGTEVFIPSSTSIKCLTWKHEEPAPIPVPKLPPKNAPFDISSEGEDQYGSCRMTPPMTPTSVTRSSAHKNFLLPLRYPRTQHLDHASRISERIHQSFSGPKRLTLQPIQIPDYCEGDSPLIRGRIPTLIKPKELTQIFRTCSDKQVVGHKMTPKSVPVRCKSVEQFLPQSEEDSSESSTLSEFSVPGAQVVVPFEHTDVDYISEREMRGSRVNALFSPRSPRYRTVSLGAPKRQNLVLKLQPVAPMFSIPEIKKSKTLECLDSRLVPEREMKGIETGQRSNCKLVSQNTPKFDLDDPWVNPDDSFYFPNESVLSTSSSSSSFSSLTKVPSNERPVLVRVIPEETESSDFLNESILHILRSDHRGQLGSVCASDPDLDEYRERRVEDHSDFIDDLVDSADETIETQQPPGFSGRDKSKFRTYFADEFGKVEAIGKRLSDLKQLMNMSQRFDVAKPYLDKISDLNKMDHSKPDAKLDEEIESCSGWNVDIELQKVNTEITSLNKLLRTGIAPLPSCRRDSSTSTATVGSNSTIPSSKGSPSSPRSFHPPLSGQSGSHRPNPMTSGTSNPGNSSRNPYPESNPFDETYRHYPYGHPPLSNSTVPLAYDYSRSSQPFGPAVSTYTPSMSTFTPAMSTYSSNFGHGSHHVEGGQYHPAWRHVGAPVEVSSNSSFSSSNASSSLGGYHLPHTSHAPHHLPHVPHHSPHLNMNIPPHPNPLDQISNCSSYHNGFDSPRSISRDSSASISYPYGQSNIQTGRGRRSERSSDHHHHHHGSLDFCSCQDSDDK